MPFRCGVSPLQSGSLFVVGLALAVTTSLWQRVDPMPPLFCDRDLPKILTPQMRLF